MSDFWDRQRAKRQGNPPHASAPVSGQPWWAQNTTLVGQQQVVEETVPEQQHDFSKADHLKKSGSCFRCGGGNFFKPTPNSPSRCFECGYIENHDLGMGQMQIAVTEGPAQAARQTVSGGGTGSNYHGNIGSVSEAVGRIT